jgi:PAS domain S-box-containing protein/putative nucleotidyltransferase with HDIG domain
VKSNIEDSPDSEHIRAMTADQPLAAIARIAENSSDLIAVISEGGVVVYANPAASMTFGVTMEEAVGSSTFSYVHPDDLDRVKTQLAQLVRSPGASVIDTVRFVSPSGVRVLQIVSTNCVDNAAVAGIVVNGRDVTERNEYVDKLQASLDAITVTVANMVEIRDPYTAGHQREVAYIATAIARELALSDDEVKGIEVASTLHDIGKNAIPTEILTRPGRLSDAEFEIIKTHSQAGYDIVAEVPFPWPVADMILQHHERLDGSGYPNGLRGSSIPMGSRILAVADVVSAMSGHRPYRPALGVDAALAEIKVQRGVLFDPVVVDSCLRLFRKGHLHLAEAVPEDG